MFNIFDKAEEIYKRMTTKHFILIALVAILCYGLYFFGLNPAKKMAEIRNSQRRNDVVNILNVVYQYTQEHEGKVPEVITANPTEICRTGGVTCQNLIDLGEIFSSEIKIISAVPVDPRENNKNSSGYQISKLANGRISVSAPLAENGAVIVLSK